MDSLPLDFVKQNCANLYKAVADVSTFFAQYHEVSSEQTIQGILTKRQAYSFLFPCTTFFTYGRGIMWCCITSTVQDNGHNVHVYFGTVDDASVDFTCYCRRETECLELYEYLKKTIHGTGLMGTDFSDRFTRENFEVWAQGLINDGGFQSKATLTFDYN